MLVLVLVLVVHGMMHTVPKTSGAGDVGGRGRTHSRLRPSGRRGGGADAVLPAAAASPAPAGPGERCRRRHRRHRRHRRGRRVSGRGGGRVGLVLCAGAAAGAAGDTGGVRVAFPFCVRSILTEIYLCHACSCRNIEWKRRGRWSGGTRCTWAAPRRHATLCTASCCWRPSRACLIRAGPPVLIAPPPPSGPRPQAAAAAAAGAGLLIRVSVVAAWRSRLALG
jgi:hypothetical protein